MFSFLKSNPHKKLSKQYENLLRQALEAQRKGDIRSYSELTAQAEQIANQLDKIKLGDQHTD